MARMTIATRREKVLRILRRRNRYQFGQPYARSNLVGNSGCSDASIQMIVLMAKGLSVSLNEVRRRSGAPARQPMDTNEALRALRSFGLPYEVRNDVTASQMMRIARARGPVIACELYWSHPQWKDYVYGGRKLNGWALDLFGRRVQVGFAKRWRRAGLTQTSFRDGHAFLVTTDMYENGVHLAVERDSNHNSPSRPERPAYDLVTARQLRRQIDSFKQKYGYRVALVPTRPVITK